MGGFLNFVVPAGEVGGSFLQQRGSEIDAARRRTQEQQGLSELVKNLGPGYEGFQRAIQMGVKPDVALQLLGPIHENQVGDQFAKLWTASGGKWTPDVTAFAVRNGLLKPETLAKMTATPGVDLTKTNLTRLQQLGISPEQYAAMTPAQKAALPWKPPEKPTKFDYETAAGRPGEAFMALGPDGKMHPVPMDLPGSIPTEGGGVMGKLGLTEQKSVDAVKQIEWQLPRATRILQNLAGTTTPWALSNQYSLYTKGYNPFGIRGRVDPRYAQYFQLIGSMKAAITAANLSGSSRSFQMVQYLMDHIPDELDPPERALEKLQGFDAGQFAALQTTLLGSGAAPPPGPGSMRARPMDFTPTKPPFAMSSDGLRKTEDGEYLVQDTKGGTYKFDPVSMSWLPIR